MVGEPRRRLNSVNHVVDILEAFAFESPTWSVSALARRLGLSKAAAHTLLANLEARQILEKDPQSSAYGIGLRLWELGLKASTANKLPDLCDPWLRSLRDESAESCYLAVYDHGEVLYVGKAESTNPVQAYALLGSRAPSHCTASGKVLLAAQSDQEIARVINGQLATYTSTTITDRTDLLRTIKNIRETGYAVSAGEWRAEVTSVAVPFVVGPRLTAAICITGPTYRFDPARAAKLVPSLQNAADEISKSIGRARSQPNSGAGQRLTRRNAKQFDDSIVEERTDGASRKIVGRRSCHAVGTGERL